MRTRFPQARAALPVLALAALSACSGNPPQSKYQQEMFDTGASQFSRGFSAGSADACEAARRTLLNQGYVTNMTHPDTVDATKDFQPDGDKHIQVEFHVVCVPGEETSDTSIVYANAVQNGFALKKTDTSASVGLSIIGSVSLPIRSNSDEMVKVSSETIQSEKFYSRFFDFLGRNLNGVIKKASPVSAVPINSTVIPAPPAAQPVSAPAPVRPAAPAAPVTLPSSSSALIMPVWPTMPAEPVALPASAPASASAPAAQPASAAAAVAQPASAPAAAAAPAPASHTAAAAAASAPAGPIADAAKTPSAAQTPTAPAPSAP
jgi:hypothetical protein